jgi:hypothetical protein
MSSELVGNDDIATTKENQPVVINVLANDCGSPPLTITAVGTASHGTVTNNPDGTVTYTPAANFFGPDKFTYTVHNALGATVTQLVRVTVNPLCPLAPTGSFNDNFESGAPGWTVQTAANNVPASVTWTNIVDPSAHSAMHSFFSDSSTLDLKDDRLIAPAQNLSSTTHLVFWHRYQFEDGYDGGVVEISTDAGATWVDAIAGGGSFAAGGYNGTINPSFGSPIAGRAAWTGGDATAAMSKVDINLGAFAGNDVRIRFRLVCDPFAAGSLPGAGWYVDDVQFTNTNVETDCPLLGVASRKTHGSTDFDIDLPLSGTAGVECRSGGANSIFNLVYTFHRNVSVPGAATKTQGNAIVGVPVLGPNANQVTVPLRSVTNAQHLIITLNGVQDTSGVLNNLVARMDVLLGDINGNGVVNSTDTSLTQAESGKTVTTANFRTDVNANGAINSTDTSIVQSKSGTGLP